MDGTERQMIAGYFNQFFVELLTEIDLHAKLTQPYHDRATNILRYLNLSAYISRIEKALLLYEDIKRIRASILIFEWVKSSKFDI